MNFSNFTIQHKEGFLNSIQNGIELLYSMRLYAFPTMGTLKGILTIQDFLPNDTDANICCIANQNQWETIQDSIPQKINEHQLLLKNYKNPNFPIIHLHHAWIEQNQLHIHNYGNLGTINLAPRPALIRNQIIYIPDNSEKIIDKMYPKWNKT